MNIDYVMAAQQCEHQLGAFGCKKRYSWREDYDKDEKPCPEGLVMCCGFCVHAEDGSCKHICQVIIAPGQLNQVLNKPDKV